ncbi:SIR2 family protein [Geomonas anaerohicana]|uniref:SIR2 family protein n=1 Tax=Geomonas anaerohicana TaxID=2798583 RepID=A0ABS0YGD0_9BACT|nr:SIR2 family protein [Geomonas anaerohicana]MBJ6750979.1 SIR2 family protein [Geomonas anaerohicana]
MARTTPAARVTTSAGQLKYKAPSSAEWRNLFVDAKAENQELENKNVKASFEALKDSLLTSLQMQNLIILTGCGTSRSAGGPTMLDLWKAAIGTPPSEIAVQVAGTIKYDLATPAPNIEDFLSRCDAYLQIEDDLAVKGLVEHSKKEILEKCSSFLENKELDGHKTFLHRLSRRRVRDSRLKIFSTNYDLCFERAAGEIGLVVIDGFSFTQPRFFDPRFFCYDIVRRPRSSEDQGSYLEGVFLLYKLHGSVNWAHTPEGRVVEKQNPEPSEACLTYPAKGKYQQSFLQPNLEMVSQYFAALREPNTCLIVTGFGFNDDHLAEPILSAVRSNPHLRLIIADYAAEDFINGKSGPSRYWKELADLSREGEDIWFINASFSDFTKLVPDLKSLSPADKLMKDIKNITGGR